MLFCLLQEGKQSGERKSEKGSGSKVRTLEHARFQLQILSETRSRPARRVASAKQCQETYALLFLCCFFNRANANAARQDSRKGKPAKKTPAAPAAPQTEEAAALDSEDLALFAQNEGYGAQLPRTS